MSYAGWRQHRTFLHRGTEQRGRAEAILRPLFKIGAPCLRAIGIKSTPSGSTLAGWTGGGRRVVGRGDMPLAIFLKDPEVSYYREQQCGAFLPVFFSL